ncbi:MAG TPA: hypothetical protein PKM78_01170 [Anaerolineae bacterium]|nr:hypothetical protein [Anaerolineae bacterium]HNU03261.1 hypothetical protein [Anaerolineae bacterium]
MPPGENVQPFPAQLEMLLLADLRGHLEESTVQVLRQIARHWGWSLKGTAKAHLVDQMLGYLSDATRMAEAIQTLPDDQILVLSWLAVMGNGDVGSTQVRGALLAGSGLRMSKKAIEASIQNLIDHGLLFYNESYGVRMPEIYRVWLPRPNTSKLLAATPERLQPFPLHTLTDLIGLTQQLISVVSAERPPATVRPKMPPTYAGGSSRDFDPRRPSLVSGNILARWGFGDPFEQHQVRFLLELMVNAKLLQVSVQSDQAVLVPIDASTRAWEVATNGERIERLRRAYLSLPKEGVSRLLSWSELDMVFDQEQGDSLRAFGYYISLDQLMQQVQLLGIWFAGLLFGLEADTWYSLDQFCRLIHQVQRNLLPPSNSVSSWSWVLGEHLVDPNHASYEVWMKSYGRIVEAWLIGPASWLLLAQVSQADGQPTAFRRPTAAPTGEAQQAPPGSLRFMVDGTIGLTNDWRASDLRRLLRFISVEAARDAATTLMRLDSSTFRSALQAGQDVASLSRSFAAAGFPLPPAVQETLQAWQNRAGRYQLYDQMVVVEFGEDVLPEELRAISRLSNAEYYQPAPRCLVFPDLQVASGLVEELRRRGYTPKVLP